jgi:hypothetical protein
MKIAILNQTTQSLPSTVTDVDAATMTAAIASQIQNDVAPIWGREAATVTFYTNSALVPSDAYVIAIVDNIPDQTPSVAGSHTETQAGQISGMVAAQPDLTNGGNVLTGDWSVSSTLSHEVVEMFIDPSCNMWANDGNGSIYSLEVCDPVEGPTYTVNGVSVANFVTPAWFDPLAPRGAQFDKMAQLTTGPQPPGGPFTTLPTGYMTYESKSGKPQQQFGTAYPAWRQAMKGGNPEGRGQQRLVQLQAMWHQ